MIGQRPRLNIGRNIGDSNYTINHPAKQIMLNRVQAQTLANTMTDLLGWPRHNVEVSDRVTKHRLGTIWPAQRRIILYAYVGGNNVHCLLHELTHHKVHGHRKDFQILHAKLLKAWETMKKGI